MSHARLMCLIGLGALSMAVEIARADAPPADESFAANHAYVKEHYTKHEYKIPMRDGITLFTAAYVPKDASRTYPILMQRTPYSLRPYGASIYPQSPRGRRARRPSSRFGLYAATPSDQHSL